MKFTTHPLAEPLPAEAGGVAAQPDQLVMLRLRVSLAHVLAKGDLLASTFYDLLFDRAPDLRPLFPADMARQRANLTQMLAWIVTNLERRDQTLPAFREMGRRHAGYGASREHYPLVRDALLEAMRRTAGPEWTQVVADEWRLSIDLIACHMNAGAARDGGAAGARDETILTAPR